MKNTKLKHNTNHVGVAVLGDPQKRKTTINAKSVGAGLVPAQNKKGITLIALIITIIVMLILVGVTINVALNGGLFKKAETGAEGTRKAIEQEELISIALGAYDADSLSVKKDNLDFNGRYTEDTDKTTENIIVVKSPSNILWQINLKTAEVKEYEERESYTFTIEDIMKVGHEASEMIRIVPVEEFWPDYVSDKLKNAAFDVYIGEGSALCASNFTCSDSRFTNIFANGEVGEPETRNGYYIGIDNGEIFFAGNFNLNEGEEDYIMKEVKFTISMP